MTRRCVPLAAVPDWLMARGSDSERNMPKGPGKDPLPVILPRGNHSLSAGATMTNR